MQFINMPLDGFESVEVGTHGTETVNGVVIRFRENGLNPRSLDYFEPDLPDGGEPLKLTLGRRASTGALAAFTGDAIILNLHDQKLIGAVSRAGKHILVVLRDTQLREVSWTIKKKFFGGLVAENIEVIAASPSGSHRLSFTFDFNDRKFSATALAHIITLGSRGKPRTIPNGPGEHRLEFSGA